MKPYLLSTLAIISLAGAATAWACFATPKEQIVPAKELIERTKTIVLAKVEKAEVLEADSIGVRYHFREIRSLKGDAPETFTIDGVSSAYSGPMGNSDHHYDKDFWKDHGGRSWHDTDCVIYPSFVVGGIFLIFLEEPYHRKSFELIVRTHGGKGIRDKWLTWVEKETNSEQDAIDK